MPVQGAGTPDARDTTLPNDCYGCWRYFQKWYWIVWREVRVGPTFGIFGLRLSLDIPRPIKVEGCHSREGGGGVFGTNPQTMSYCEGRGPDSV